MNTLVTGGASYIELHAIIKLISRGHLATISDNLSDNIQKILHYTERVNQQYSWRAEKLIEEVSTDSWQRQSQTTNGFSE